MEEEELETIESLVEEYGYFQKRMHEGWKKRKEPKEMMQRLTDAYFEADRNELYFECLEKWGGDRGDRDFLWKMQNLFREARRNIAIELSGGTWQDVENEHDELKKCFLRGFDTDLAGEEEILDRQRALLNALEGNA